MQNSYRTCYYPRSGSTWEIEGFVFPGVYSDYYILELDEENYNYALIGSSTDKYLWILSRTPQLPEEVKKKLVTAAERRGYDTTRLKWIEQL